MYYNKSVSPPAGYSVLLFLTCFTWSSLHHYSTQGGSVIITKYYGLSYILCDNDPLIIHQVLEHPGPVLECAATVPLWSVTTGPAVIETIPTHICRVVVLWRVHLDPPGFLGLIHTSLLSLRCMSGWQ